MEKKKKKSSSELYEEWPKHVSEGSKHTGQEKKCIKGIQLFPVTSSEITVDDVIRNSTSRLHFL